jgi:beta-phosphoglucomutase
MRKPEAVIFDMDGVLIDSEPIHYKIEKNLFDQLGITVGDVVHQSYLGASNELMYSDLKSRFGLKESVAQLVEMDELFRCDYFRHLPIIPLNEGVINLLHEIKLAGLKLAVATSSSPAIADILLRRCEIASFFDIIVTTKEAGRSKPAPDVYIHTAKKLGVAPANCIVFEDSLNGLSAAQSAGMYCIAVSSGNENVGSFSNAEFIIQTFTDITVGRLFELFAFRKETD